MKFTASQQAALDLTRHLGITANAGSGKTRVLVERYVNILEQEQDTTPRNVVAITFTEAAAAELRGRIVREIDDRIAQGGERHRMRRLENIRNDIKSGYIGTIHSFATRLLKAYPVEANVDAQFSILSGADERLMQEDAVSTVFFDVLQSAYDDGKSLELLEIFRLFGRQELTQKMQSFFQNRSRVASIITLLERSEDEVVAMWKDTIEELCAQTVNTNTLNDLQSILTFAKDGKRKSDALLALEGFRLADGLPAKLNAYDNAFSKIITQNGTVNSFLVKDENILFDLAPLVKKLVLQHASVSKIVQYIPESAEEFEQGHRELYRHLKLILHLWDQVLQEYSERKSTLGLLDFDDLIEKAERLLAIPLVASELTARFRYIMIDEYQDTDESQFRIARALTESFSTRNKLAVVGDPKQSIYCFRNADATVFQSTLEEIKAQPTATRTNDGVVSLQESFRMLPYPLAFINKVFGDVMKPSGNALATEEVLYEPLVQGRKSESKGSVEFLLADEELQLGGYEEGEESSLNEFGLIARKIRTILASENDYLVDDKGSLRKATAKDIAVLLRSRTLLNELEAALRAEDIPYIVRKGAGFFAQQEITDIISYLKFLLSSADDVSLVAILRSPFFAISDTVLFQIGVHAREQKYQAVGDHPVTFWESVRNYVRAIEKPHELLKRAIEIIESNLLLVGRVPIARLVEKIYTESAILATHSAAPHGSQKIANLRKFLDICRQADSSGFSTLFDFVERVDHLMMEGDSEAQADVNTDEDAVQIMTVHGAKGLEFPIVIAASLHRQFNFERIRVLDKELGLMLNYPDTDKASKRPAICELIRLRSDQNTLAEEKRILYVALTRAKDHLIVSGTLKKSSRESSLSWILNAISPEGFGDRPQSIKLLETIGVYDDDSGKTSAEEIVHEIKVSYNVNVPDTETVSTIPELSLGKLRLDPIEVIYRPERFSATQLLTYLQCPTKYYLSFGLGIPEEPKLAYDAQPDELSEQVHEAYDPSVSRRENVSGTLAGQIIHALLEKIDDLVTDDHLDSDRFNAHLSLIGTSLGIVREEELKPIRNRARRDIQNFISSDFGKFVLSCRTFHTELPVQSQLDRENSLYGIVDRLFREPDGTWHLLDYKTDGRRRSNKDEQYAFQLGYYASLIGRLYPGSATIKTTLFYTQLGEAVHKAYDLSEFVEIESRYQGIIAGIRADEKIPALNVLHRNLSHCEDCNYFDGKKKQCVVPLD